MVCEARVLCLQDNIFRCRKMDNYDMVKKLHFFVIPVCAQGLSSLTTPSRQPKHKPGPRPELSFPAPTRNGRQPIPTSQEDHMSEDIVMIAAHNLQLRRKQAGFTQKETAHLLGLEAETVCRMEKGHNPVSLKRLQQFADLYSCTVIDLLQPPKA